MTTSFFDRHIQPAIHQAERNADEQWKEAAAECLRQVAETHAEFTADEVQHLLDEREVTTHNPSALGPVFLAAARGGLIVNTNRMVQTKIPRRHRKVTVWKSNVFKP